MGQGTGQIREEIEETRARVGEEVEALSYKTDVGARLDDYVDAKKEAVTSSVKGAAHSVGSAVGSVVPSKERMRRLKSTAQRNPLGLAVGGAAVGFVAGMLLPSTRVEEEQLGEVSSRVKETVKEAGHEAIDRGKDVAQSAVQTVKDEGSEQGKELANELKDRVQQPEPAQGRQSSG
jgi:gas vesicle protein